MCLFVLLGGSAVAATVITGKNVKNSSLTGKDVKNSSLTGRDVKNRSLRSEDFAPGQLPQGLKGDTGPPGQDGAPGPVHQVVGVIKNDCTLQAPIMGVSVTENGTNGCTIIFPGSYFTAIPILMLTPINGSGGNPTSIAEQFLAPNWVARYTFTSVPPPLVNFIASQQSQ